MKSFIPGIALLVLIAGSSQGAEEGTFDRSLTVSGPVELDVLTDSGGITVRQGSSGEVRIHARLKASDGWFSSTNAAARIRELIKNPPVEQSGNRIRVGYTNVHDMLRDISMSLEIETPSDTQLRARADSGGIRVSGIRGPVDCKTDSGGVEVNDVSAAVRAAADSGGIAVTHAESLFARADSGSIRASQIAGAIDAEADSGSITVGQTSPADVRLRADSGSVRVSLVPGAGYNVNVATDSGRISAPEITVHGNISPNHLEGRVGNGGPMVKINVESGSVSIN
jgi:hypothetical protein